ncbi:MAG: thioredoxin family protein [Acidimicrobiia bacterium]|nr:thioredoxin family protein [Acidimicrobiia bacterium]
MAGSPPSAAPVLPDGLVAVVKRDCPTCVLVAPVLDELAARGAALTVYTQDDLAFPLTAVPVADDTNLAVSWHHGIETVPTLIRVKDGSEVERTVGWSRSHWEALAHVEGLGAGLPEMRPGCGSLSLDPDLADVLAVRFSGSVLRGRRIELAALEDEMEATFDRGWTDGLPVVPPTEARVLRMLAGTSRDPADIVAVVPPDLTAVTVEQVAINAVLAGCRPEYLPVVLAAVEAACTEEFNIHGLLATTYFSGPIVVVNGPIAQRIGMNSTNNVLGQGNRANLTIGRALQLVVANLGGGRPGRLGRPGIDMALMGAPGKIGCAFAEREADSPFEPLAVERGLAPGVDAVTLFAGHGPTAIVDQLSRSPESVTRSIAAALRAHGHPKLALGFDAMLVVGPEHGRLLREAGWDKVRFRAELDELLMMDVDDIVQGVDGIDEGMPASMAGRRVPKFRPGGLQIVHAGGDAGLFSAILGGWVGGAKGSTPVTHPVTDIPSTVPSPPGGPA